MSKAICPAPCAESISIKMPRCRVSSRIRSAGIRRPVEYWMCEKNTMRVLGVIAASI